MPERGAVPQVPTVGLRALRLARSFTSPLLPDDYLELINPLWTTRELRGRVERLERETADAVTVLIKPGWQWPGHRAGQYLRLGLEVDGVHHWRAYSLTSDPGRPDGCIAITPKLVESGKVSPFLCRRLRAGTIVRLGGVEGTFVLPDPAPSLYAMIPYSVRLANSNALSSIGTIQTRQARCAPRCLVRLSHVREKPARPRIGRPARSFS